MEFIYIYIFIVCIYVDPVWKYPYRRSHAATKVRPVQQHQWHFQSWLLVHLRGVGPCWGEPMTRKASTWCCEIELYISMNLFCIIIVVYIICDLSSWRCITKWFVFFKLDLEAMHASSIFPSTIGAAWQLKIFQHDNCMHESPKRYWSCLHHWLQGMKAPKW